jgi:carbon monoxide dehydrogenase subunit G
VKLEGSQDIALPPPLAWERLADPRALRACVPGPERLEAQGPDRYDALLEVKIPAVTGRFEGSLEYLERQPPDRLRLRLRGKGALGFVDGDVVLTLAGVDLPGGAGTRVQYAADVQVGGQVGRLGQRMISGVTREMAGQFFGALERWQPEAPAARAAPSPARALLPLVVGSALRWLGLRRD